MEEIATIALTVIVVSLYTAEAIARVCCWDLRPEYKKAKVPPALQ